MRKIAVIPSLGELHHPPFIPHYATFLRTVVHKALFPAPFLAAL